MFKISLKLIQKRIRYVYISCIYIDSNGYLKILVEHIIIRQTVNNYFHTFLFKTRQIQQIDHSLGNKNSRKNSN